MILRRNSYNPIRQLRHEMDRLVGDFFGPVPNSGLVRPLATTRAFPAINVWEQGEEYFVEAELPGLKHEDIDISVVGNELTLRGQRNDAAQTGATYHRHERGVGEFNRVVRLPVDVDATKVEASLTDGVLLVKLPKAESAKPKKIKVSSPAIDG